jgi:UDP-N-acetyl-D-mannosaminuronic acid transferase (WecB/TagA/CpsF family)
VAHNFYFKFIPEARHYNNEEVNAYIDNLLANDPMHTWMSQNTAEIKKAIKDGEFQKIYEQLFDQKMM